MRRKCTLAGTFVLLCALPLAAQSDSNPAGRATAPDSTNPPLASQPASGTIPRLIKFTGAVKDLTGEVPTGVVGLTFSLYELPEGGNPLWVETQNLTLDSLGHYTALLGANSPGGLPQDLFTSSKALWLGVQAQLPGEAEQARVLLVAVPYALKSSDADTLGGLPASAYLLAGSAITAEGVGPPGPVPPPGSTLPSGPITGEGTSNSVPMFTGSYKIANSPIIFNPAGNMTLMPQNGVNSNFTVQNTAGSTVAQMGGSGTVSGVVLGEIHNVSPGASLPVGYLVSLNSNDGSVDSASVYGASVVGVVEQVETLPGGQMQAVVATKGLAQVHLSNGAQAEPGWWVVQDPAISREGYAVPPGTEISPGVTPQVIGVVTGEAATTSDFTVIELTIDAQSLVNPVAGSGTITAVNAGMGITGGGTSGNVTVGIDTTVVPTLPAAFNSFAGVVGASAGTFSGSSNTVVSGTNTASGTVGQLSTIAAGYPTGVYGLGTIGVYGYTAVGPGSYGIYGTDIGGLQGVGVFGSSNGTGGYGVQGVSLTNKAGYGVYATGDTGVTGISMASSYGIGVNGQSPYGTGGLGVQGQGDTGGQFISNPTSGFGGTGVSASSSGSNGKAVFGSSTGSSATGVWAQSTGMNGIGVTAISLPGMSGYGLSTSGDTGVLATSTASGPSGTIGYGVYAGGFFGVYGQSTQALCTEECPPLAAGVLGVGNNIGVASDGDEVVDGDLYVSGTIYGTLADPSDDRIVALYAVESPENWFEDFGSAELRGGIADVALDPNFALTVNSGAAYHVFLTPNGDCKGLYVVQKSATGFQVRELQGGRSNISFDYRIVAKRRGFENVRMADLGNDHATAQRIRQSAARGVARHSLVFPTPAKPPQPPAAPEPPRAITAPAIRALAPANPPEPSRMAAPLAPPKAPVPPASPATTTPKPQGAAELPQHPEAQQHPEPPPN